MKWLVVPLLGVLCLSGCRTFERLEASCGILLAPHICEAVSIVRAAGEDVRDASGVILPERDESEPAADAETDS